MERVEAYEKLSNLLSEVYQTMQPTEDAPRSDAYYERKTAASELRFRLWNAICDYRDACTQVFK